MSAQCLRRKRLVWADFQKRRVAATRSGVNLGNEEVGPLEGVPRRIGVRLVPGGWLGGKKVSARRRALSLLV